MQGKRNDKAKLRRYDFYEYIHSQSKNTKKRSKLRGIRPEEIKVYVEGLADVTDVKEYDWYFTSTLKAVDKSSLPIKRKIALKSAIPIGTASYGLWSIEERIQDEK